MSYDLILGDRAYSSWSLRGWLLFEAFAIAVKTRYVQFHDASVAEQLTAHAPAQTVPTLVTPEGAVIGDSLAIAEELATRHPDAGIWPSNPLARATARSLAAEMHSGFGALRNDCPMNLRCAYSSYAAPDAVQADTFRIDTIWNHALNRFGRPWLCGGYSAADAFYAPVAARIAGYGLAMSGAAQAYVDRHLADPAFRRWRAMAIVEGPDLARYARGHDQTDWSGPPPRLAQAVRSGPSENATALIPASLSPISWKRTGGSSVSATPSAATKPWPTPMPGRNS